MCMPMLRALVTISVAAALVIRAEPSRAEPTGAGLHDPSRLLASNGKVFVYSTEGQSRGDYVSSDGLVFTAVTPPPFNPNLLSGNQGVWAPDGITLNNQFYIYYAMWSSSKESAIALLTNPALDPSAANYKWTDRGIVIHSPASPTYSMIDPCPVLDAQGNLWMSWGGGYPFNAADESLWVTRLDNTTGLPLMSDPVNASANPGHPIATGHREGSYLHYHNGYYYLFWQTGNGFDPGTSYQINMSRATAIVGPYSGDQVFYSRNPAPGIYGPGHMGIYSCGGDERFTYHYYSNDTTSGSALGENALTWDSSGWPRPGAVSTAPLNPSCQPTFMPGGTGGGSDAGGDSASSGSSTTAGLDGSGPSETSTVGDPGSTSASDDGSTDESSTGSTTGSSSTGPTHDEPDGGVTSGGSGGAASTGAGGGGSSAVGGDEAGKQGSQPSPSSNSGAASGCRCSSVGDSAGHGGPVAPIGLIGLLAVLGRRRAKP